MNRFSKFLALSIPALAPAYEPPTPEITLGTDSATISWVGGGTLQYSDSLDSGWTDAGATASPQMVDTTGLTRSLGPQAERGHAGTSLALSMRRT